MIRKRTVFASSLRKRVDNNVAGFTLLEILVVLAILGMGMGLITQMTIVSARNSERVEEDTFVQLACENMMNSILAGNMTATIGVSTPVPDAPNWETTVELLDGPIQKLIAIRITAQRYEIQEYPSLDGSGTPIVEKTPDEARRFVIKEYARRADVKTRVVRIDSQGKTTVVEGTGDTVAKDVAGVLGQMGTGMDSGALGGSGGDPFAAIDQALDQTNTLNSSENLGGSGLGGGSIGSDIDQGFGNIGF